MAAAFIFKADVLCKACAAAREHEAFREGVFESEDSDDLPQGPYAYGGGEADCPQHCGDCGEFLENPLTPHGVAYVADLLGQHKASGRGSRAVLAAWVAEYAPDWPAIASAAEKAGFA